MNEAVLETKRHALFHSRLMRSSAVWIAVLLIHLSLWIAFKDGRDMFWPHQNTSTYLSVVLITLNDSLHASHVVESNPKDVSKISATLPKRRSKELQSPEEMPAPQKPSLQSADDGSRKPIKELDFEEMKRAALAVTHEPQKRMLPGIDKKISKAQKFADAIDHAKRGDCRSEYAYIGILALPFLLKDTLTDQGCKW